MLRTGMGQACWILSASSPQPGDLNQLPYLTKHILFTCKVGWLFQFRGVSRWQSAQLPAGQRGHTKHMRAHLLLPVTHGEGKPTADKGNHPLRYRPLCMVVRYTDSGARWSGSRGLYRLITSLSNILFIC